MNSLTRKYLAPLKKTNGLLLEWNRPYFIILKASQFFFNALWIAFWISTIGMMRKPIARAIANSASEI